MKKHFLLLILSLLFLPIAQGKVKLPAMMGDHMVLQQNSSVKLWGWADGKKVTVTTSWNNRTYQASTDKDGAWLVKVDTPEGGYTPYSITISDGTPVTLSDILIGEVWICSGQSNMEMRMMGNAAQPINHSLETLLNSGNYRDRIRFITVPRTNDTERRTDFEKRKWEVSSPETSIDCSAAAYFFARQLTESLHLPVGLVINSWGGSAIEAWMDEPTLKTVEGMNIEAAKNPKRGVHQRLECLYNSMLWPVKNFTARGFLWYQGESNAHNWEAHEKLFKLLVNSWRKNWNDACLPFYYVQLSSLNRPSWPWFRESQRRMLNEISHIGMAVSSDHGDSLDVHPTCKKPVGERLARWALNKTYQKNVIPSGPLFRGANVRGGKVFLSFDYGKGMRSSDGKPLQCFEVAEYDGIYYPATAEVVGDQVKVYSKEVPNPRYVRYGWQPFTRANLINREGLPASTFRAEFSMK